MKKQRGEIREKTEKDKGGLRERREGRTKNRGGLER